jgi:hypothetical protein
MARIARTSKHGRGSENVQGGGSAFAQTCGMTRGVPQSTTTQSTKDVQGSDIDNIDTRDTISVFENAQN